MKVVISAGGTGGHIYPALAIIDKIKQMEPDSKFLYIGTHDRMEKDIIPKHNIPFESIEMYGFYRKHLLKNFKTIKTFFQSYKKCKKLIKKFNPDVVIGVGGYVTGPVIYTAHKLGYKTFIHEQNTIPGKCNKFLSGFVNKIGVSFKSSIKYFPEYKTVFTGNPRSESVLDYDPINKKDLNLSPNKKLVTFVMGSLGATKVNEILVKTMNKFEYKNYEVLFITGENDYKTISNNNFPKNVKVVPYIEGLPSVMKKTDLIVTRAGATTLSEIIALGLPSIIIPSPYVPDNHQYKNAIDLVDNNAALMIEEKDLNSDILVAKIDEVMNNESLANNLKFNIGKFHIENSSTEIYEILKDLIDRK